MGIDNVTNPKKKRIIATSVKWIDIPQKNGDTALKIEKQNTRELIKEMILEVRETEIFNK